MKNQRKWFGLLLTAVLVCLMVCSLPVGADDETDIPDDIDSDKISGYYSPDGSSSEKDGEDISVYT